MLRQLRLRPSFALLLCSSFFLLPSRTEALPEKELRQRFQLAVELEKQFKWDQARDIYEELLSQRDPGLKIRERYLRSLRRGWQVRRQQDTSYRKEVLSIEYAQALRMYTIISNTLLDLSVDKKKLDPAKLFRKGVEELDAALGDPYFQQQHLPGIKLEKIEEFRVFLRKTWGSARGLSRKEAAKQLGEVAMEAELKLQLNPTVTVMEFACGSCYAIDEYTTYLTPNQLRELVQSLARNEVVGLPSMASVSGGMLPNSVGLMKITSFTDLTVQEVDAFLNNPAQRGMKGLILDLRGNNGGLFDSAIDTARRFLSKGTIASTVHQDAKYNVVYQAKNANALMVPLVLLVDGDTASAAEVLAGALKDNDRALLIGQTTYGKSCTQCVLKLPNALGGVPTGGLKVTEARFFSPKGIAYSGRGITPHIFIEEQMPSQSDMTDHALTRALVEMTRLLAMPK